MPYLLKYGPWAGWPLAALCFWLWLGARDDVAAEIERCNTDKAEAIARAEEIVREAEREAADAAIADLRQLVVEAEKAREIAAEAARIAESTPERVRTVIREVSNENTCLDMPVPGRVVDGLRGCEDRREARPGRNRPVRAGECSG
jgi:hypothetical protein